METRRNGVLGWLLVGVVVFVWDFFAVRTGRLETLSQAYARAIRTRSGRAVVDVATFVFLSHLRRWPPGLRRFDPLSALARVMSGGGYGSN